MEFRYKSELREGLEFKVIIEEARFSMRAWLYPEYRGAKFALFAYYFPRNCDIDWENVEDIKEHLKWNWEEEFVTRWKMRFEEIDRDLEKRGLAVYPS